MADTSVFEVARQTHEEVERHIQSVVDHLSSRGGPSSLQKESLRRQHQISAVLDRIVSRNATLNAIYTDVTGDNVREMAALQGSSLEFDGNAYATAAEAEFYNRMDRIRKYHKKYPNAASDLVTYQLDDESVTQLNGESFERMFSGEEMVGRFLDLYVHHEAFLNLKGVRRISYLQYVDSFDKIRGQDSRVTNETKRTEAYKVYVNGLQAYLLQFLRKTRPLSDVDSLEIGALVSFEDDWEKGTLEGWEDQGDSVLDVRKHANMTSSSQRQNGSEGIWCDACQRSFTKQTVFDAHLKAPKHLKAADRKEREGKDESTQTERQTSETIELERTKRRAKARAIARDESMIVALGAELRTVRSETRSNVERKAALTERERQAEAEEAAAAASSQGRAERETAGGAKVDDDEDDEGEKIYNPLKLPLGWDGKPIPFWLYKLHGLGVEYKCEICSDYVYQGRKNFERHFSESRHAFGMRALGLPNTKHFYEITRIEDALALADKLKKQGKVVAEEQGDAEEVEDEHGNTYTRKTYDLLKRQGLI